MQKIAGKTELSAKQTAFLAALLSSPTVQSAAKVAGISERQAYSMRSDPVFAEAYRRAQRNLLEHSVGVLQSARSIAIQTLVSCTRSDVSPSVRVAAARTLLELADKSVELGDFQERLEALEAALAGQQPGAKLRSVPGGKSGSAS